MKLQIEQPQEDREKKQLEFQNYLKFVSKVEQPFRDVLIPIERLKLALDAVAPAADNSKAIQQLKDLVPELDKTKTPELFEHCVHSLKAGNAWIDEVNKRNVLIKMIKYYTQDALEKIQIAPSMITSQDKLKQALKAFSLVSKFGQQLDQFQAWKEMISDLMLEAKTLTPKPKKSASVIITG